MEESNKYYNELSLENDNLKINIENYKNELNNYKFLNNTKTKNPNDT